MEGNEEGLQVPFRFKDKNILQLKASHDIKLEVECSSPEKTQCDLCLNSTLVRRFNLQGQDQEKTLTVTPVHNLFNEDVNWLQV